jgi:maleylacetate reductase
LENTLDADPIKLTFELMLKVGNFKTLKEFGLSENDLQQAIDLIMERPYYSPRPLEPEGISKMLLQAFEGKTPGALW